MSRTVVHHKYEYWSNRRGSEMGDEAGQRPADCSVREDTCTAGI